VRVSSQIHAKNELIRNLQFKLAARPPLLDHMSFGGLLEELDEKSRLWAQCSLRCMEQIARDKASLRRRTFLLERCLSLACVAVGNYLMHLEGLHGKVDSKKLLPIVRGSAIHWYKRLSQEVHKAFGVKVDLSLAPPRDYAISAAEHGTPGSSGSLA
jgi:hypothetical protein